VTAKGVCSTHTQHGESRDVNQGSLTKCQRLYENNLTVTLYLFAALNKLYYCIASSFVFLIYHVKKEIFVASDLLMQEHSAS
jgi:hypothetical protein